MFIGLMPGELSELLSIPEDSFIDWHMKIGRMMVYAATLLCVAKLASRVSGVHIASHPNIVINFILRNHWITVSSNIFAQYLTIMYSRQISEYLNVPRILIKGCHRTGALILFAQVIVLTMIRQYQTVDAVIVARSQKNKSN